MKIKVKVNGYDRTNMVRAESIKISSVITNRIDTCQLTFEDTFDMVDFTEWDEIIISDGYWRDPLVHSYTSPFNLRETYMPNAGETIRYFAGFISNIKRDIEGITKIYHCQCQDYTILLDRTLVNEVYASQTDAQILTAIFTKYLPEIDASTYVATGNTHDKITFNRATLREVIDILSRESGLDWYVDYNKNLRYFTKETNLAPFGLSDSPDNSTTYPYGSLSYERDFTSPINRVTVIGGYYLSDDNDFELPGNAQTTELWLPYRMTAPDGETQILVWENIGTDGAPNWSALGVGIDNIDTLGGAIDVLHNQEEKLLKFGTAPPLLKRAIKVHAKYDVKVLVRVTSQESYSTYGRWFDGKVVNQDINSRGWAKLEGKAVLAQNAFVRESGNLKITQDGLQSGMLISIVNALRGLDGDYLIHEVKSRLLGGETWEYTIGFGEYNTDLVDMLITMKANTRQYYASREDEVLNELFEQAETLSLVEATDRHEDAFPPDWSRWIALPPDQGAGYHIRHEGLALAEAPARSEHLTEAYKWDDGTKWGFGTWK